MLSRNPIFITFIIAMLALANGCKGSDGGTGSPGSPSQPQNPQTPNGPGNLPVDEKWDVNAKDAGAVEMSRRLQKYHSPHGLVYSAGYTEPGGSQLWRWDGVADSAIWTGTHLAAQGFWYRVTRSEEALTGMRRTVEAIRIISQINGDGVLARHFYPLNDPQLFAYLNDNSDLVNIQKKTFEGQEYYYLTRTSRDQYAGIYFGLGVAYDMVDDVELKNKIRAIVTSLTDYLLKTGWFTFNPDGSIRTTFVQMPQQQLSILQVARHVNPAKFAAEYEKLRSTSATKTWLPMFIEGMSKTLSYYKFNLNHEYMYNLMRLEEKNSPFMGEYKKHGRHSQTALKGTKTRIS
ncbi:MAG: hypothetical protein ABL958_05165 [Bdellovibrionia bacterium]